MPFFAFSSEKGIFEPDFKRGFHDSVGSDHIAISRVAQAARRAPARDVHRQGPGVSIVFRSCSNATTVCCAACCVRRASANWRLRARSTASSSRCAMPPSTGREFRLDGFGVLHPGPNRTIAFAYEPRPAQPAASDTAAVPAGTQICPCGAEAPKLPYSEPRVSPSAKMNPDPSVRGLRYGKPPKTTAAYSYVDRPPRRRRRPLHLGRRHCRRHRRRRHRLRLSA